METNYYNRQKLVLLYKKQKSSIIVYKNGNKDFFDLYPTNLQKKKK